MRLQLKRLTQSGIGLTLLVVLATLSTMGLWAEDGEGETPKPWTTVGEPSRDQLRADGALHMDAVDAAGLVSDDFNSCQLDETLWTYLDPLGEGATKDMNGIQLSITVPPDKNYYLWSEENHAPRVLQNVENGAFEVVVKFESIPTDPYQLQGIIVQGTGDDANKLLRFEFYSGEPDLDPNTGGPRLYIFAGALVESPTLDFGLAKKNDFIGTIGTGGTDVVDPTQPIYMRVSRSLVGGDYQWKQEYSLDDGATWVGGVVDFSGTTVGGVPVDYNNMLPGQVGVYAGDFSGNAGNPAGSPGYTAIFDYFFTTDAPIDPEDAKGYDVTTSTVGQGSVQVAPPEGPYTCGDPLTFTAVPEDEDWTFDNWSGDVTGQVSPTTTDYVMGLTTTATFISESAPVTHTLSLSTGSGNGVALPSPNLPFYADGQQVVLTATPDAGFEFSSWSGDATGVTNPITITMDSDKTVAANFSGVEPEGFTLEVQVFNNGKVSKDPDKSSYTPGEQVSLTAEPDPGWAFSGWSGDAAGTETSVTITMDEDKLVLATFTEEEYTVGVNTLGDGTVQVQPPQSTYKYDDEITLTATPAEGWEFVSWSGDLDSSDNPASYTVKGNASIKATFTSLGTDVYMPIVRK